jgi:hypothetical protein
MLASAPASAASATPRLRCPLPVKKQVMRQSGRIDRPAS